MKQLGILAFLVVLFEASAVANPYLPSRRTANEASGGDLGGHRRLSCISTAASITGFSKSTALSASTSISAANHRRSPPWRTTRSSSTTARPTAVCPVWRPGSKPRFVASPLVKLPYVMVARKEIRRPEDLKGKSIGVTRPGDLSARLSRQVVRKFGLTTDDVTIHPIGGSQTERYQAMVGNVVQAILVTPPLGCPRQARRLQRHLPADRP